MVIDVYFGIVHYSNHFEIVSLFNSYQIAILKVKKKYFAEEKFKMNSFLSLMFIVNNFSCS